MIRFALPDSIGDVMELVPDALMGQDVEWCLFLNQADDGMAVLIEFRYHPRVPGWNRDPVLGQVGYPANAVRVTLLWYPNTDFYEQNLSWS